MRGRRPPSTIRPAQPLIRAPKPSIRTTDPIEIRGIAAAKTPTPASTFKAHTPVSVVGSKPTAMSQPEPASGTKNAELRGRLAVLAERNEALELALKNLVEAVIGSDKSALSSACAHAIALVGPKEIGCSNPKK